MLLIFLIVDLSFPEVGDIPSPIDADVELSVVNDSTERLFIVMGLPYVR